MAFGVHHRPPRCWPSGMPPAQASALVHTAEIFTTGASAASHVYHRNVDWRLVSRLGVAGVLGAVLGAWILSNVDVARDAPLRLRLSSADGRLHPVASRCGSRRCASVRPAGRRRSASSPAFSMPAAAAAGGRSRHRRWSAPDMRRGRRSVRSTPRSSLSRSRRRPPSSSSSARRRCSNLVPLVLGGLLAAPVGGWAVKRIPARALMIAVGSLIVALSLLQLARVVQADLSTRPLLRHQDLLAGRRQRRHQDRLCERRSASAPPASS